MSDSETTDSRKSLHPSFRKKPVVELDCKYCGNCLCSRGMKAILLADTSVELYSTDWPPHRSVDLVNDAYCTEKCLCKIKDVACLGCGNVVGYTVVLPCKPCLTSCNNGHLWMFNSSAVDAQDRLDRSGCEVMMWGCLIEEEAESRCQSQTTEEEECIR
eukprot:GHVU01026986.1.p1 GENE.GHVU01026986.1~~GHVU01026986.1.p1  ORF type:complete len:159 (+),score=6.76 GHVU01026986.1:214-690(+)